MAFRVGQRVVCVDDAGHYGPWRPINVGMGGLKRGEIYTVRRVGLYRDVPALWLNEIDRSHLVCGSPWEEYGEPGFARQRFRHVVERKTDISALTALLNPANHTPLWDEQMDKYRELTKSS